MLGLKLRAEFRGARLKGTQIDLANPNNTGATQVPAAQFLDITYPTSDLLAVLRAAGPARGAPVAIMGERGLGKSHLLGALYHALSDGAATKAWLAHWAGVLGDAAMAAIPLRSGMHVITASLQQQRHRFLWDLLFDKHPRGDHYRGKWAGMGASQTDVPPDTLLIEMLRERPAALVLDEFQTWFDGLVDTKDKPHRTWAFNFVQTLSEIGKEHPELLLLVVSIRNGHSDAFQQIQRIHPALANFSGAYAKRDRRRLLLHRLFENRLNVADADIEAAVGPHASEHLRLAEVPDGLHAETRREFMEAWPFAPHLLQLLEDQILVATSAQENRDLIKILAGLFKSRGDRVPVLSAADFHIDDEDSGIGPLLDSVSNPQHQALREKVRRNRDAVLAATDRPDRDVPRLEDLLASLWLRSIAVGKAVGATREQLQVDCTRGAALDENAFAAELETLVDNSFNLHDCGGRLVFKEEENAEAKLKSAARNPRLFAAGDDLAHLAREARYAVGGDDAVARSFRVIALPKDWSTDPWTALEPSERPDAWDDRLPVLVLPEAPDRLGERLGGWLKDHLQKRRNTVRFVLPRAGAAPLFADPDLLFHARAVVKAAEWRGQGPEYAKLERKYQGLLRGLLKDRFDRFAILSAWNFAKPACSRFAEEPLGARGSDIPEAIERSIAQNLFEPEVFRDFVLAAAGENASVRKVLDELREPRPAPHETIPWLGEHAMKERLLRVCAQGEISIDNQGREMLQREAGEDADAAFSRLKGRLPMGKHLEDTFLGLPGAVTASVGGTMPAAPASLLSKGVGGAGPHSGPAAPGPSAPPSGETGAGFGAPETRTPSAGIFGRADVAGAEPPRCTPLSLGATSPLNLLARLEDWKVGVATQVRSVRVVLDKATGAQLQQLLKALPPGLTYALELEREDGSA